MTLIQGSREFQQSCVVRLQQILATHGYDEVRFDYVANGRPHFFAKLDFQNQKHEIEVYEDGPVMHSGGQLFEAYMTEEFKSEAALREGFATRLSRYLSGGPWDGPDEPSFAESAKLFFKRLFRR